MKFLVSTSAALLLTAFAGAAMAQSPEVRQPWCSTDQSAALNCVYPTLAACEQVIRGEGGECVPDPRPAVK